MKKYFEKLRGYFLVEEGGKRVINKKRFALVSLTILFIGLLIELVPSFFENELPAGGVVKSDAPLVTESSSQAKKKEQSPSDAIGGISNEIPRAKKVSSRSGVPIKFKAKQVLTPDAVAERIPTGANFVGKLLTSVDTRSPQRINVILPYGGSHKSGGGSLPPETILIGEFTYSGQGERVFMVFNKAILPEGEEVPIYAQALSSKDYKAGIIGDYHSNRGDRMASALGLSMVSGISEVMVEREALGNSFEPTPKANLKNGIYNGVAKVAEMEAANEMSKLGEAPSFVTLDAGQDLIISLGQNFEKNERQQQ